MADFVKLSDNDLDDVSGGALVWTGAGVYPADNSSAVYQFNDFEGCLAYIREHWGGAVQTEETLKMLEAAGLVWKA